MLLLDWMYPIIYDKHNKVHDNYWYVVLYGGRGSGKSEQVSRALIIRSLDAKRKIICAREFQKNMDASVYSLIKENIINHKLESYFTILKNKIICNLNGSEFNFVGLQNTHGLKGYANFTDLWLEEADTVTHESWTDLYPTLRQNKSTLWITMNPRYADDCLFKEFVNTDAIRDKCIVKKINYTDNPFFSERLEHDRLYCMRTQPASMYKWIWEGELKEVSEAQVFADKWYVDTFDEDQTAYKYYGLDFGFSVDPLAAIRCYIDDENNYLYITHEAYSSKIEINNIGAFCESKIPGFKKSKIIADSEAPDKISYLYNQGYNVVGAVKGKGSVEAGIDYIRSFAKVIIHHRCENVINEFRKYSYKVDKRSGEILPKIESGFDHAIDALRYALERAMRNKNVTYENISNLNFFNESYC